MAQRLDRIEERRAAGGIESEHDPDGDAEADRQKYGLRTEDERPFGKRRDPGRSGHPESDTDHPAYARQRDRLYQELR